MNCVQCNAPLEQGARFCRNCGYPVPASAWTPQQNDASTMVAPPELTFPQSAQPAQPSQFQQPQYSEQASWQPQQAQPAAQQPPWMQQQYSSPAAANPGTLPSAGAPPQSAPRRSRKKWPWPFKVLITLGVVVVLLVGGWFLVARPILHNMAVDQFNQTLSSKLSLVLPIPFITTVPLTEGTINSLLSIAPPPAPLQNAVVHIAPPVVASDGSYTGGVQFSFQVYGFNNSITMIPTVNNGQIVMTSVKVDGPISWILSADDMTSLLNAQLQNAVSRIGRQVTGITLKDQEADIQLGSPVTPVF